MNLYQKIDEDFKEALKMGETERLSVLRLIKTAIINQEKQDGLSAQAGKPINDDQILSLINREIKQRQDTIAQLQSTRPEMVAGDKKAIELLKKYLPQQLSIDELKKIIDQAVSQTGAKIPQDMGKVIGVVIAQTKGRADGSAVSQLVKAKLSA